MRCAQMRDKDTCLCWGEREHVQATWIVAKEACAFREHYVKKSDLLSKRLSKIDFYL